jgi:hypothetical protein
VFSKYINYRVNYEIAKYTWLFVHKRSTRLYENSTFLISKIAVLLSKPHFAANRAALVFCCKKKDGEYNK